MPKQYTETRAHRAQQLLERVQRGPSVHVNIRPDETVVERLSEQYQNWVQSWVLHELDSLAPALRETRRTSRRQQERAYALRSRIAAGPEWSDDAQLDRQGYSQLYCAWAQQFVLDELVALVPELRKSQGA